MEIKPEIIDMVAKLAYIEVSGAMKSEFAESLASILDYVGELQQVDTSGVEGESSAGGQIAGLTNMLQADTIEDCELSREELLAQAPSSDRGMVRVPKIIG